MSENQAEYRVETIGSPVNESIMRLISADPAVAHWGYEELRKRWPQINEQTKVTYTPNHIIEFYAGPTVDWFDNHPRQSINAWKRFKACLYPPSHWDMDDPIKRYKYSGRLIKSFLSLPLPRFWRLAGSLFHRQDWIIRGTEIAPDMQASLPIISDEVRLETFAWQTRSWGYEPETTYLVCGYHAASDTFYVYQ